VLVDDVAVQARHSSGRCDDRLGLRGAALHVGCMGEWLQTLGAPFPCGSAESASESDAQARRPRLCRDWARPCPAASAPGLVRGRRWAGFARGSSRVPVKPGAARAPTVCPAYAIVSRLDVPIWSMRFYDPLGDRKISHSI
jgi:hypothetical protein